MRGRVASPFLTALYSHLYVRHPITPAVPRCGGQARGFITQGGMSSVQFSFNLKFHNIQIVQYAYNETKIDNYNIANTICK